MDDKTVKKGTATIVRFGSYVFRPAERTLALGRQLMRLTEKENGLLEMLCRSANRLLTRTAALENLWSGDTYFNARSMDVYVSRLRKLLRDDPDVLIMNVHGKGFKLIVPNISVETDAAYAE